MTTVLDFKKRIQQVDVAFESEEAINATRSSILDKQRDQLLHGLTASGGKIGFYKSAVYAAKKNKMNSLPGFGIMDWKLTGSLHKELFVEPRGGTLFISSLDPKTESLVEKEGDPFGLTSKNKKAYIKESLFAVFMKRIRKAISL
jgi:hypothetical protein